MKHAEGSVGRAFILRLEEGDVVPECIERFAREHGIRHAQAVFVGGVCGGRVVSGPRESAAMPPDPMLFPVEEAHEVAAVGVLAPAEDGRPVLHMHGALGRAGQTLTGCFSPGVTTWLVGEVALTEIVGANAVRRRDARSGLALLQPED